VFGVAFLVSPFAIKGGAFFDTRFSIIFGYLIFFGIREVRLPERHVAMPVAIGFLLLFGLRIGLLSVVWRQQAGEVTQMREAIAPITPGSRVLVATVFPPDPADYWSRTPLVRRIGGVYVGNPHLPALILIERHAFWQLLFAARSQQPITILPPYAQSSVAEMNWGPPPYELLRTGWQLPEDRLKFPYLKDWWTKYDFVLILNAGGVSNRRDFLFPRLKLLADTDVAVLYRVNSEENPNTESTGRN
jgi:hypothetical protein